jgi:predicted peptidase
MKKWTALFAIMAFSHMAMAQDNRLFERQLFLQGNDTLFLRILTPANYSPSKKYPLVLFLHGSGERGRDNDAQLTWGASLFLDSMNRVKYPAIVVFPQCPTDSSWAQTRHSATKDSLGGFSVRTDIPATRPLQLVMDFLDTLVIHGAVDPKRMYVGGLSMGGFGTFDILWRKSDLFAAAIPICGGGDPEKVLVYRKKLPIWVFHGDADPVVPVANSRRMVNALKAAGANVKYTEYPGVGHDSWKDAFKEPELLPWLFAQRKK